MLFRLSIPDAGSSSHQKNPVGELFCYTAIVRAPMKPSRGGGLHILPAEAVRGSRNVLLYSKVSL